MKAFIPIGIEFSSMKNSILDGVYPPFTGRLPCVKVNWPGYIFNLLLLGISLNLFAIDKGGSSNVGGGGHILKCDNQYELYDYYEQKILTGLELDMPGEKAKDKISFVLERLKKFDPELSQKLFGMSNNIFDNLQNLFHRYGTFPDLFDYNHFLEFPHCERLRFAIQYHNPFPFQKKYLFNYELWNLAKEEDRAGIILHEIIYTYRLEQGDQTSDFTRYLNFIISSNFLNTATLKDYYQIKRGQELQYMNHVLNALKTYEESVKGEWSQRNLSTIQIQELLHNIIFKILSILIHPYEAPYHLTGPMPFSDIQSNPIYYHRSHIQIIFYLLLGKNFEPNQIPLCSNYMSTPSPCSGVLPFLNSSTEENAEYRNQVYKQEMSIYFQRAEVLVNKALERTIQAASIERSDSSSGLLPYSSN